MFIHLYQIPPKNRDEIDGSLGHHCQFIETPLPKIDEPICLVKENVDSDKFLRAYLKYCNPNHNFCSHVFFMQNDTKTFLLADAVMNIDPDAKTLSKIVENTVDFYRQLHLDEYKPTVHVNLLTNSGHFSLSNPTSCKMQLVKDYFDSHPMVNNDLHITTWQLDTCLYNKARRVKGIVGDTFLYSPDIIIVPNLDTGNAIYKALMQEYKCYGFVIGGTTPAILNSRSDLDKNEEAIKILKDLNLVK